MKTHLARMQGSFAAATMAVCLAAGATERGTLLDHRAYVSGGVGVGEIETLQAERRRYSVKVMTALRRSGAFLAGSHLKITDGLRNVVFDRELDGPWLLIDLPPGRYRFELRDGMQRQYRAVTLEAGQMRDVNFYFDPGDQ